MVKKVVITFPGESAGRSLTYELVKEFDIKVNILKADMELSRGGKLVVELDADADKIDRAIAYMEQSGVEVSSVGSKIRHNSELCIDCGACTSSCLAGALSIQAPDWKLNFDPDKCVVCKLCLGSCPLGLFEIEFA